MSAKNDNGYNVVKPRSKYKIVKRKLKITTRERRFMKLYVPAYKYGAPSSDRPWLVVGAQYFPFNVSFNRGEKESLEWCRWQIAKALIAVVDAEKGADEKKINGKK